MKSTVLTALFLSLLISGCVTTNPVPSKPTTPVETPTVPSQPTQTPNPENTGTGSTYTEPTKPLPSATGKFTAQISTENCDATQVAKVTEAEKWIVAIFNSEEYKHEVVSFMYDGEAQFNWNEDMSNLQIYNHLIKGAEALQPVEDYEMDITMSCYYQNNSTVGYTYPTVMKIYANMKFHSAYDSCDVASNTTHEWTHKMGFDHAQRWSEARDYTVPYGHNTIIRKLCPLAKQGKLTPLK